MEQWLIPVLTSLISVCGAFVTVAYSRRSMRAERLETAEPLATRFREPLLQAAFNLETRNYNIVQLGFFARFLVADSTEDEREHAELNMVYVIAQYFCWLETLRREWQFVDPRNDQRNHEVVRALGEIQLVPALNPLAGAPRWEGMGYAASVRALDDPQTARWFHRLRADVAAPAQGVGGHDVRLRLTQQRVMDIPDTVDPDARRVPAELGTRLERASPSTQGPARQG